MNNLWKSRKKSLLTILLALVCLLILTILLYTGTIWPNAVFAAKYSVQGLDVSSYQHNIDWKSVAQTDKYAFVFIKATEGKNYQDAYFKANWQGAKAQGLLRGAYHFYSASRTGAEQADNYISLVPKEKGMLPPVLDLEVSGTNHDAMLAQIKIFLDLMQKHYGMRPIIYTDRSRYIEYVKGNFDNYSIWMRDVIIPANWDSVKNWALWQYDSRGHIPGINGYVDLNVFSGTKKQLDALAS